MSKPLQVVTGRALTQYSDEQLHALVLAAPRVIVDVGTGDARTAYRLARNNASTLVIGIDPAWQRMVETSSRARRKPERGGAPNLLLVNAAVESVPEVLHECAHELLVLMPWGKLLQGIVCGHEDVCGGLRSLARPGAGAQITIDTSIWREPIPREIVGLPELTEHYVRSALTESMRAVGWDVTGFTHTTSAATAGDRADIVARSSWGRRLRAERVAQVAQLSLKAATSSRTSRHALPARGAA